MFMLKIVALLGWALIIAAFFGLLPADYAKWLTLAGSALLVLHLVEYFLFNKKIRARGDGEIKSFVMTILFGVVYFGAG